VECLLKLGRHEEADKFYKNAQRFAPNELDRIERLIADDVRRRGLELNQAKQIEGMEAAFKKLEEAEKLFKGNPNDNDMRKKVVAMLEECLEVFDRGKNEFPLNQLIDGRIVKANRVLVWARKMTVTEDKPVEAPKKDDTPPEVDKSL
jgi:hypothetical protein